MNTLLSGTSLNTYNSAQNAKLLVRFFNAALGLGIVLAPAASAQVNVTTQHNDNSRSGANLQEAFLTPANVTESSFGKLFSVVLDGQVYAQPLYVSNVKIPGQGVRNVVYVATMNNTVYALDADNPTRQYWKANFGIAVKPADLGLDGNITYSIGILGTPVIDLATNTIYFVSRTETNVGTKTGTFTQSLNAIDIVTGAPKFGSPVAIKATYTTADGVLTFDPKIQNQRPALTLANGDIYIAWASHDDRGDYHGWVMAYKASNLAQDHVYSDTSTAATSTANTTGNAPQTRAQGGIWQAGQGLTVDATGNVYFSSGNGSFEVSGGGVQQTGNSFVKLSPALKLLDFFTPYNSASLNMRDSDLGSAGLLNLPGTNMMISGGKAGIFYLVDGTMMGKFNASQDQVQQEFRAIYGTGSQHIHGGPVYFDGATNGPTVYVWGENDVLRAFSYSKSANLFSTNPLAKSSMTAPMTNANGAMPGGFLSISANGTSNGIVWASTPFNGNAVHVTVPGVLHAFNANTLTELWTDKTNAARDENGNFAKYNPPTIANGKLYVANFGPLDAPDGSGGINVYGLLNLIPDGKYTITSVNSGMLLEVPGGSTANGTVLDQAPLTGLAPQEWTVTNLGSNVIRMTNVQSGQEVDDSNNSTSSNAAIVQYPNNNGANQHWRVNEVSPGVYSLTNVLSGFALDVIGASKAAGAKMDQYYPLVQANQHWTFQAK